MTAEEARLHEKIVRAKVKLEGSKKEHASNCRVVLDPESTAPCSCGATDFNKVVDAALNELE